ncbi:hypothetical protein [Mycoplasma suis]|uniref:hypothetical protein n=1 Tax=Mycoplasma suis TaxID=57372 RepID=UPI00032178D6|nr:hypothetical protein [Mycoplasma suis]
MFFGLKSIVLPVLLGVSGIAVVGGYGAANYFNVFGIKKEREIAPIEYILKEKDQSKDSTCFEWWGNGNERNMDKNVCQQIIQEKWNNQKDQQPDFWLRSENKDIVGALSNLINEEGKGNESISVELFLPIQNTELTSKSMNCFKKPIKDGKIEVSCTFTENAKRH